MARALGRPRRLNARPSALLPDHRHRLSEQQARPAHPVRGDRGGRDRALASDEGRRHAIPDRDGRALREHRAAGRRAWPRHARLRRRDGRAVHLRGGRPADRAGSLHPDDRPRSPAREPGDGSSGVRKRRRVPRQVRGLVLPERGLQGAVRPARDARRDALPEPPEHRAPVADRAQLVLPPVGVSRPAGRALRGEPGVGPARVPQERDARRSCAAAWRTSPSRARPCTGASRSRSRRTARPRSARTARGTPRRASSTSGSTR